ncbi:MAG: hypothetical protein DGJ47_001112 [Rickettsiaceae bacterium]
MGKLLKYTTLFLLSIFILMGGLWYYVTLKVASEINQQYAGKKIAVKDLKSEDYFITFKNASPSGFPSKISWKINGFIEESRKSYIEYLSPIKFGYDLIKQQAFISYSGDIIASYKPKRHGFGSRLKLNNYRLQADIPLTYEIISALKENQDPAVLINYCKNIILSSDKVQMFDLVDKEKYYDKEYEKLFFDYVPAKKYSTIKELLNDIPKQYKINYQVKTNNNSAPKRKLPVSLFYVFSQLPSGMNLKLTADIKTQGSSYKDYMHGLDIKSRLSGKVSYLEVKDLNLDYKTGNNINSSSYDLKHSMKFKLQEGFFDHLISEYKNSYNNAKITGQFVNREINYIIKHRDDLRLNELENNDYELNVDMSSEQRGKTAYSSWRDLSIFSKNSGIRVKQDMEQALKSSRYKAKGVLYLDNYSEIVDFASAYIYRFGKYRSLNDQARKLYVGVNKSFLKDISDHPRSTSNDLSFEYNFDSAFPQKAKFGSAYILKIPQLYTLMVYQKLFDTVGFEGDVLQNMRKILPSIDGNEPMLKNILPKVIPSDKLEKEIKKIVPTKILEEGLFKKLIK